MKQPRYMFCTKQFKPFIILVVLIAVLAVGWTALKGGNPVRAGNRAVMPAATAPPIKPGARAPHPDWGKCSMCHDVIGATGKQAAAVMAVATAPAIKAGQKAPHPDWGSCAKCHHVIGGAKKNPGRPAALLSSTAPPLGIWIRPLTPATADRLGLENADGVLITGVYDPSPGKQAGLQVGDVIRRIEGRKIESLSEALAVIAQTGPGDTVRLQIMRDGRARKMFVTVDQGRNTAPVVQRPVAGRLAAAAVPGRVALAATGRDAGAQVAPRFGQAPVFIIYDPKRRRFTLIENRGLGSLTAGRLAARQLIDARVGAVITGNMGPGTMLGLRAAGVQVYTGAFGSIQEVTSQYLDGKLTGAIVTRLPNNNPAPAGGSKIIAVASQGPTLDSPVAADLGLAPYLIIYDQASGQAQAVAKEVEPGGAGAQTAHVIVERGASGVIAGNISPAAARSLTGLGVFTFTGVQGRVSEAIGLYRKGGLQATTLPAAGRVATPNGVAL